MRNRQGMAAVGLAAALAALWSSGAWAEEVTVTGCVRAGVEAGCLLLDTGDKVYNISAANPRPAPGAVGRITGTVSNAVSFCGQGIVVAPVTWETLQGATCPDPNRR